MFAGNLLFLAVSRFCVYRHLIRGTGPFEIAESGHGGLAFSGGFLCVFFFVRGRGTL